jgi:hypothetical protein
VDERAYFRLSRVEIVRRENVETRTKFYYTFDRTWVGEIDKGIVLGFEEACRVRDLLGPEVELDQTAESKRYNDYSRFG